MEIQLDIMDDSGLLALVDATSYRSFVGEHWNYEQLVRHFAAEMHRRSILVWDCGDGGNTYRIRLRDRICATTGYREVTGRILVTGKGLHVASYTALTMAAQFADCRIPERIEKNLAISLAPGEYRVRIVQMYDPATLEPPEFGAHFHIEFERGDGPPWETIAWHCE